MRPIFQATRVCMCWDRAGIQWPVTPPARTVQGSTVEFWTPMPSSDPAPSPGALPLLPRQTTWWFLRQEVQLQRCSLSAWLTSPPHPRCSLPGRLADWGRGADPAPSCLLGAQS